MNTSGQRSRVRHMAVLVVVACVVAAALFARHRRRPERHLAEAARLLDEGDPDGALHWLALPEATPRARDRALLLHARAALARDQLPEAVRLLERVDKTGPSAIDLAFWKGRALYAGKQSARAVAWFLQVLERRPNDVETLRWLAAASYDLGDRMSAMSALKRVTRLAPDDARAWRTLALLYKEDADPENARLAYEATLRLNPSQPRARLELAETLVTLGAHRDAENQLSLCRGQVPEADRAALQTACLLARGEVAEAQAVLDGALSRNPSHAGLLAARAQLDASHGHFDEALARLDRALAAEPYNAPWLYRRGTLLRRLGRAQDARRDLDRARELNAWLEELSALDLEAARHPGDPEVRARLGELCVRLGKRELAASWFRAALACNPSHAAAREGLSRLGPP